MATVGRNRVELIPHGPAEFTTTLGANTILLCSERGAEGRRIRQFMGTQEGPAFGEQALMEPLSAVYAGTHRSEELAASLTVIVVEDAIQVKLPSGSTATMRRICDGVFLARGTTLRFDQPKEGRIEGFALNQGRVRGIRFVLTAGKPP